MLPLHSGSGKSKNCNHRPGAREDAPRTDRCSNRCCPQILFILLSGENPGTKATAAAFTQSFCPLRCLSGNRIFNLKTEQQSSRYWRIAALLIFAFFINRPRQLLHFLPVQSYTLSRISTSSLPNGVWIVTVSPGRARISPLPIGDQREMQNSSSSASPGITIL